MELIYVYDPLCGWCYGFSSTIQSFANDHPEFKVEVISGGMVTGDRVAPLSTIAPYLREAYKDVENRTGVRFGERYLETLFGEATMVMNSLPPSLALTVYKQMTQTPEKVLAFSSDLQRGIYFYGYEPESYDWYGKLAVQYGLDEKRFVAAMRDPRTLEATQAEFARSGALGVNGFPTVLIRQNDRYQVLSRGYLSKAQLEAKLQDIQR